MAATPSIVSTGSTFRIYDDSVKTHDSLPSGTYKVRFSEMSGYSLQRVERLEVGEEKVYGKHQSRVDRVMRTYHSLTRSLGVLLSGDKGMGKSLLVRMLAEEAQNNGLPVIIVDANTPGLPDFIDSLGEALVLFDEFEKIFPHRGDGPSSQDSFLSLFDGTSTTKRLYAVTVNHLGNLSDYFVNRPGRFHYHMRFDYPTAEEVREYMLDQAPNATTNDIYATVAFSQKVNVNYDHLRAIAFEIDRGESFTSIIDDLNIKRLSEVQYAFRAVWPSGDHVDATVYLDLFSPRSEQFVIYGPGQVRWIVELDTSGIEVNDHGLQLPASAVKVSLSDEEGEEGNPVPPSRFELRIKGASSISYAV